MDGDGGSPLGVARLKQALPSERYVTEAKLKARFECGRVGGLFLKKEWKARNVESPMTDLGAPESTQKDGGERLKLEGLLLKI